MKRDRTIIRQRSVALRRWTPGRRSQRRKKASERPSRSYAESLYKAECQSRCPQKKSPIWKDVVLQSNHISIPSNGWQVTRRSLLELLLTFWAEIIPFPNISFQTSVWSTYPHFTERAPWVRTPMNLVDKTLAPGALQRTKGVRGVWTRWFNKAMMKQQI